ncbi:flagellinolysin [Paenibacillus sp. VMFN-D1]|uniref:flagellinolysin n=1 Tax=Paenibacillus sp. VMFN-D1 TaxID=2135608 RepID=UPI000E257497|nr:flagellinolysin [Paenibacillus sp. VMFN-D1]RED33786.1 flagellin [Paenibacillus sp. VMFN-D1]
MRINHNLASLNTHRQLALNTNQVNKSIEKLSSGMRINRARDDAAGLAISEKMRSQIRGLDQASRNIQDGISLIQTAEGGLNEVHALLQRGRELAVQSANDTLTTSDKEELQKEVDQIKDEINGISNRTEFNGIKLLNVGGTPVTEEKDIKQQVLDALPGILENSEKMIEDYFGLHGDFSNMTVFLDDSYDGPGGTLAFVSASVQGNEGKNVELHIDMSDFPKYIAPNGNSDPFNYLDRTIAHEMVHAVFDRTLNMDQDLNDDGTAGDLAVPKWFNEGSAEYIKGGADRLYAEIANRVNGGQSFDDAATEVMNSLGDDGQAWGGGSVDYAAAYAAIVYLNNNISTESGGAFTGYKDFLNALYDSGSRAQTVDSIFAQITSSNASTRWGSMADFVADFKENGLNTVKQLYDDFENSKDVGSPASPVNQEDVVQDDLSDPDKAMNPLKYWNVIFPGTIGAEDTVAPEPLILQLGANAGQTMGVELANVSTAVLKLDNVDIAADSGKAITSFDRAISQVSSIRSRFGAMQNRLEHALSVTEINKTNLTDAESRIRDVDMAKEMMEQTRASLLTQTAQAMLAQANQQPQGVLQLLR